MDVEKGFNTKAILTRIERTYSRSKHASRDVHVRSDSIKIGRHLSMDFIIDDPLISVHHAIIDRKENRWYIKDTFSRNGTFVNGRKITPQKWYRLLSGDLISFVDEHTYRYRLTITSKPKTQPNPQSRTERTQLTHRTKPTQRIRQTKQPRKPKTLQNKAVRTQQNTSLQTQPESKDDDNTKATAQQERKENEGYVTQDGRVVPYKLRSIGRPVPSILDWVSIFNALLSSIDTLENRESTKSATALQNDQLLEKQANHLGRMYRHAYFALNRLQNEQPSATTMRTLLMECAQYIQLPPKSKSEKSNTDAAKCRICDQRYINGRSGIGNIGCSDHATICNECIATWLNIQVNTANIHPWILCGDANCRQPIHPDIMMKYLQPKKLYEFACQFLLCHLSRNQNWIQCINSNKCQFGVLMSRNPPPQTSISCEACKASHKITQP